MGNTLIRYVCLYCKAAILEGDFYCWECSMCGARYDVEDITPCVECEKNLIEEVCVFNEITKRHYACSACGRIHSNADLLSPEESVTIKHTDVIPDGDCMCQ